MKRIILILLLLSLLFLSGCTDYKAKYEELYDQYTDLEAKYDEDTSRLNREMEDIYSRIQSTDDYIHVLYDYFEDQAVTFDAAYNAYDELHTILVSFY